MKPVEMITNILTEYNKLSPDKRSVAALVVSYGYDLSVDIYSLIPNLGDSDGYGFDESRQCEVLVWNLMDLDNHPDITDEEIRSKLRERLECQYRKLLKAIDNLKNFNGDCNELMYKQNKALQERYRKLKDNEEFVKGQIVPTVKAAMSELCSKEDSIENAKYQVYQKILDRMESGEISIEMTKDINDN